MPTPSEASIIPFQRLRVAFCLGSIAEPLSAYQCGASSGASSGAKRLGDDEHDVGVDADAEDHHNKSQLHSSSQRGGAPSSSSISGSNDVIVVTPLSATASSTHKRGVSRHTHRWCCYLRPVDDGEESVLFYSLIRSVTFKLDRSFNEPIRVVDEPPFAVTDIAWAEHHIEVLVTFVDEAGMTPLSSGGGGAGAAGDDAPLLLHHTVILRERVAPEFCPIGLSAARMVANGEPTKCFVVPDSLTQGTGGGIQAIDDDDDKHLRPFARDASSLSTPPSCSNIVRERILGLHQDNNTRASIRAMMSVAMYSGGNAQTGGRVAISERFDSLLITHPRRRSMLFFQNLLRECRQLESAALHPTFGESVSQRIILRGGDDDDDRSDDNESADAHRRNGHPLRGKKNAASSRRSSMASPRESGDNASSPIFLRAARLGYERLRSKESELVERTTQFFATLQKLQQRMSMPSSATMATPPMSDDEATLFVMNVLVLRLEHQVRQGFALRSAAQERSTTALAMALEVLEDERVASLEELNTIDMQIGRLRNRAVHMMTRFRSRLKRMRGDDGGSDGSDDHLLEGVITDDLLFARARGLVAAAAQQLGTNSAFVEIDDSVMVVDDDV